MSILFMAVSIVAAAFSCLCAYRTLKANREIRAAIAHKLELLDQINSEGPVSRAAAPRYREYGDLS